MLFLASSFSGWSYHLGNGEAITLFNRWMYLHTETIPLPLDDLAKITIQNPLSARGAFGFTVMLFSTFLPTLCHIAFVLFQCSACCAETPKSWRLSMAQRISETKSSADSIFPVVYFSAIPIVGVIGVLALAWLTFEVLSILGAPMSKFLYMVVQRIIS